MIKTKLSSSRYYLRNFQKIKARYEALEAMEEVRPILEIIADSEKLEIVCDFLNYSIGYTLPQMPFVEGLCCYNLQLILISSLSIGSQALSIIVHEFIHYLMYVKKIIAWQKR